MSFDLKPTEIRVLGVLIEKSLSQPAYYPMTLNAITAACNQKTNRNPVVAYAEGEVSAAVASLRRRQLVAQADPDRSSRAVRFKHELETRFDWNAAQRAIVAELLLRGPQTVGELRGRASRMTHLASADYARELLVELAGAQPPIVVELPREPGKTSRRFAHLLGGEVTVAAQASPAMTDMPTATSEAPLLADRVLKLEEVVTNLSASLAGIRHHLRQAGLLPDDE